MEFRILGPLEITGPDGPVELGSTKLRSVLALLLIHAGEVVSAGRLIDDLWEGTPPRSATATLQTYISQVRKQLGPAVVQSVSGGYRFNLEGHRLDAVEFQTAFNEVAGSTNDDPTINAARLREALVLWRGTALADFPGAHWATAEAARLEGLRQIAAEDLIEARLALGEHARLVPELEAAVAANPLQERPWAQLMLALYRCGRQADALRAYGRLRAHLGEELGIEPSAELTQLEQAILLQEPELDWRPPLGESAPAVVGPAGLPTGVVTFLLTDVVGSAQLWDEQPAPMAEALIVHDALIGDAVQGNEGRLLTQRREGDSTFAVFTRATDALACALDAQAALTDHPWPAGTRVLVRMALHTGEAIERDGDYYGPTVNRAARLRSLAEGGQVLASQSTVELLVDHLPADVALVELGPRSLQGLRRAEHVYAVVSANSPQLSGTDDSDEEIPPIPGPLAQPTSEPFVGRTDELAVLEKAWQAARAGERRAVLLAGEPGIGKTRLAAELARQVSADGGTVLYGRSDDELGVAFQPFTEAIREYMTASSPATMRTHGGPALSDLSRLVPELASIFPGLPRPCNSDPETERYELFESVVSLLANASRAAPIMLILDDLHWATKPTLLLLRHLLRTNTPMPVLMLGTYRCTEAGRGSVLGEMLPDLRSPPGVESIALHGFSSDEVSEYLSSAAGTHDESAELADSLQRKTNGNPLFVREMVRSRAERGGSDETADHTGDDVFVPQSVRDVIERRLARLSPSARQMLASASIIGPSVRVDLLERLAGSDTDKGVLLDAIDEAVDAGIVNEPANADTLEFTHAVIRQTIYTSLTGARRVRLHQHVAQTLESLGEIDYDDDERLPALAYHWAQSARLGDTGKAANYALRASRQALARLAYEEAAVHLQRALYALEPGPHHASTRSRLLLMLAEACKYAADRDAARDAARRAAQEGRDEPELFAFAAISHAEWSGFGEIDVEGVHMLREALALAGDTQTIARAKVLATLAICLSLQGDPASGGVYAEEAIDIARTVEDPATLFNALFARNVSLEGDSDVALRLALTRELVQIGAEVDDPSVYLPALENDQYARVELGDLTGFSSYLETFSDETERVQQRHRVLHRPSQLLGFLPWHLPLVVNRDQTFLSLLQGDWDRADARIMQLGALAAARKDRNFINTAAVQLVHLRREQGRVQEILPEIQAAIASNPNFAALHAAAALLAAEVNDFNLAREHVAVLMHDDCTSAHRGLMWTATLAMLAETCAVLRDRKRARVLFDQFGSHAGHLVVVGNLIACMGAVDRYLGMLETVLGDWEDAERHFKGALALEERIESRPSVARTQYWYGSMLVQREKSDQELGRALLTEARTTAESLHMTQLAAHAMERLEAS